jgi:hypothetical protein
MYLDADQFSDSIQRASVSASERLILGLAGMGTTPQTPPPPLMILLAS